MFDPARPWLRALGVESVPYHARGRSEGPLSASEVSSVWFRQSCKVVGAACVSDWGDGDYCRHGYRRGAASTAHPRAQQEPLHSAQEALDNKPHALLQTSAARAHTSARLLGDTLCSTQTHGTRDAGDRE